MAPEAESYAIGYVMMAKRKKTSEPIKLKCEKCLKEWERARPATYENCQFKASAECPVNKAIALRSFS